MKNDEESTWGDLIGIPADPPVRRNICDNCKYGILCFHKKS